MKRSDSGVLTVAKRCLRDYRHLLGAGPAVPLALALVTLGLGGCAGLVSGANTGATSTSTTPDSIDISNVQATPATNVSAQIVWTTSTPATSAVDYGTSAVYGQSTPLDPALVTNHQVTVSGLSAGTTYYYQVRSDSKTNHGNSGGHSFKTAGFNISGTISPAAGASGSTLTLSGAASATTTADSLGNYTFTGLANGSYTVVPSRAGYTFTPGSQSTAVNGASITGVNFTDSTPTTAPTITSQPVNQTVISGQTATFAVAAAGSGPMSYQWQKSGVNITGATSATYTTPPTTPADNGAAFTAAVNNSAGTAISAPAILTVNAPNLQLSANSINFPNAVVGNSLSQALIISNIGTAMLNITQISESGAGFKLSGFSLPLSIAAGQQSNIAVAFVPTAAGPASGNISIVSNAAPSPASVSLSGTGSAATFTLGISPLSLSFGNVTTATSSATQTLAVTNTGNSSVAISQITLTGAGYTMTGGNAATLSPSQSIALQVQFNPSVAGTVNGTISIVSNANGSPAAVPLTGTGVAPVAHTAGLAWSASTSVIAGYNIYRSAMAGGPYAKINTSLVGGLSYIDSTVQSGTTYHYVTTAVDAGGNESVFSNEVSALIP